MPITLIIYRNDDAHSVYHVVKTNCLKFCKKEGHKWMKKKNDYSYELLLQFMSMEALIFIEHSGKSELQVITEIIESHCFILSTGILSMAGSHRPEKSTQLVTGTA